MKMKRMIALTLVAQLLMVGCGKETAQPEVQPSEAQIEASADSSDSLPVDVAEPDLEEEEKVEEVVEESTAPAKEYTTYDVVNALDPSRGIEVTYGEKGGLTTIGTYPKDNIFYMKSEKQVGDTLNEGSFYMVDDTIYYYIGANGVHMLEGHIKSDTLSSSLEENGADMDSLIGAVDSIESVEFIENKDYNDANYDVVRVHSKGSAPEDRQTLTSEDVAEATDALTEGVEEATGDASTAADIAGAIGESEGFIAEEPGTFTSADTTLDVYFNTETGVVDYIESNGSIAKITFPGEYTMPVWFATSPEVAPDSEEAGQAMGVIFAIMFLTASEEPITEESIAEGLGDMGIVGDLMTNGVSATFGSDTTEGN